MTPLEAWMKEVRERLDKATPGPWEAQTEHGYAYEESLCVFAGSEIILKCYPRCSDFGEQAASDASLIAECPTDLDRALRALEVLRESLGNIITEMQIAPKPSPEWMADRAIKALDRADCIAKGDECLKT